MAGEVFIKKGHMDLDCRSTASMVGGFIACFTSEVCELFCFRGLRKRGAEGKAGSRDGFKFFVEADRGVWS